MAASSIEIDAELKSDVVLARADDGTLEERVERWLALLSERWTDALPTSDDAASSRTLFQRLRARSFIRLEARCEARLRGDELSR